MMTSLFDKYLEQNDAFAGRGKPELSKAHRALKVVLVVVNVIFLIFAIVLIAVGSYAYNNNSLGSLTGETLPLGIVVLGVFILFISLLGCISAWRESRVFLGVYFFFLSIMTFLLFVIGIVVYVKKDDARSYIEDGWNSASVDLRTSMQNLFDCCGLNNYTEWNVTNWLDALTHCPTPPNGQPANYSGWAACADVLEGDFRDQFNTVGTCGIVFAVLMTACTVFVCCLIRGIHQKNMKADVGGLNPGDDSSNPTSLESPAAATMSAAAAYPTSNV